MKNPLHFVKKRPNFGPTQIRKASELEMGKIYVWHFKGLKYEIEIVSTVFTIKGPDKFKAVTYKIDNVVKWISLFYLGLAKNGDGYWHKDNWLEPK